MLDRDGHASETEVEVRNGSEAEVRLVIEREREVEIRVVGSQGPVLGASVRAGPILEDPGPHNGWSERITNSDGIAKYWMPPATRAVQVVVLAPGYGARLSEVTLGPEGTPIEISLTPAMGTLSVELPEIERGGLHLLRREGATFPLQSLLYWARRDPATGRWLFDLEMGEWWVCRGPERDDTCRGGFLGPGGWLELDPDD